MSTEAGAALGSGPPPAGSTRFVNLRALARWCRDSVAEPVVSVLFPPRCVGCGDFESHLCPYCEASLEPVGDDCCPRCGEPGPRPLVRVRCSHCMGLELAYAGARSAFIHAGPAKRLVVEFKAGGQPVLAPLMARLAAPAFAALVAAASTAMGGGREASRSDESRGCPSARGVVVTWVPTHPIAQRERGYNQAEVLARALAAAHRPPLPAVPSARKRLRTRHQKALDRAGRQANLRGAFGLDPKAFDGLARRPLALVLVDDVYTTGATAQEVAHVLTAQTGIPVYVFTFSRAASARGEKHD